MARNLDRPLFKVIGDKSLLRIAEMMPDTLGELERIHGVSRKQVRWIGKGLLSAVRRGSHKQPPPRPRVKRLSDSHLNRIDQLRRWRKRTARAMKVQSDIVLPKDLMLILASKNPQSKQELGKILRSVPWRFEKYGDEIFNLLRASTS
jgi:ribonuclease D